MIITMMMMMMMMMMIIITIPGEAVQTIETNNSRKHIIRSENNSLRDLQVIRKRKSITVTFITHSNFFLP